MSPLPRRCRAALALLLAAPLLTSAAPGEAPALRVGVTLHAYYAWVSQVGGSAVQVVPLLPPGSDPHVYQPRPQEVAQLRELDAVVGNGLGHDAFLDALLEAAGRRELARIDLHRGVPLLPASGALGAANPHSFLCVLGAVQQLHNLAEQLGALAPAHAAQFRSNARRYARRLRALLADALVRLSALDARAARIATVHDGYAYLLAELGLRAEAVVQPRHGMEPSARQLADTIRQLRERRVNVLFAEAEYSPRALEVLRREAGTAVHRLSHLSAGEYTPELFERGLARNLDAIVAALQEAQP